MRRWIRDNPWIWLLLIVFLFLAANSVFLKVATSVSPQEIVD